MVGRATDDIFYEEYNDKEKQYNNRYQVNGASVEVSPERDYEYHSARKSKRKNSARSLISHTTNAYSEGYSESLPIIDNKSTHETYDQYKYDPQSRMTTTSHYTNTIESYPYYNHSNPDDEYNDDESSPPQSARSTRSRKRKKKKKKKSSKPKTRAGKRVLSYGAPIPIHKVHRHHSPGNRDMDAKKKALESIDKNIEMKKRQQKQLELALNIKKRQLQTVRRKTKGSSNGIEHVTQSMLRKYQVPGTSPHQLLQKFQQTNKALNSKEERLKELSIEIKHTQEILQQREEQIIDQEKLLHKDATMLKKNLKEAKHIEDRYKKRYNELMIQKEHMDRIENELKRSLEALRIKQNECRGMEDELQARTQLNEEKEAAIRKLQHLLSADRAQLDSQLQEFSKEKRDYEKNLESMKDELRDERAALREEKREAENLNRQLKENVNEENKTLNELKRSYDELQEKFEFLQAENREITVDLESTKQELSKKTSYNEEYEKQLSERASEHSEVVSQIAMLKEDLEKSKAELNLSKEKLEAFESKNVDEIQKLNEQQEQKLAELKNELFLKTNSESSLQTECTNLKDDLSMHQQEIEKLKKELSLKEETTEQLQATVTSNEDIIVTLKSQNHALSTELNQLQKELDVLNMDSSSSKQELSKLKEQKESDLASVIHEKADILDAWRRQESILERSHKKRVAEQSTKLNNQFDDLLSTVTVDEKSPFDMNDSNVSDNSYHGQSQEDDFTQVISDIQETEDSLKNLASFAAEFEHIQHQLANDQKTLDEKLSRLDQHTETQEIIDSLHEREEKLTKKVQDSQKRLFSTLDNFGEEVARMEQVEERMTSFKSQISQLKQTIEEYKNNEIMITKNYERMIEEKEESYQKQTKKAEQKQHSLLASIQDIETKIDEQEEELNKKETLIANLKELQSEIEHIPAEKMLIFAKFWNNADEEIQEEVIQLLGSKKDCERDVFSYKLKYTAEEYNQLDSIISCISEDIDMDISQDESMEEMGVIAETSKQTLYIKLKRLAKEKKIAETQLEAYKNGQKELFDAAQKKLSEDLNKKLAEAHALTENLSALKQDLHEEQSNRDKEFEIERSNILKEQASLAEAKVKYDELSDQYKNKMTEIEEIRKNLDNTQRKLENDQRDFDEKLQNILEKERELRSKELQINDEVRRHKEKVEKQLKDDHNLQSKELRDSFDANCRKVEEQFRMQKEEVETKMKLLAEQKIEHHKQTEVKLQKERVSVLKKQLANSEAEASELRKKMNAQEAIIHKHQLIIEQLLLKVGDTELPIEYQNYEEWQHALKEREMEADHIKKKYLRKEEEWNLNHKMAQQSLQDQWEDYNSKMEELEKREADLHYHRTQLTARLNAIDSHDTHKMLLQNGNSTTRKTHLMPQANGPLIGKLSSTFNNPHVIEGLLSPQHQTPQVKQLRRSSNTDSVISDGSIDETMNDSLHSMDPSQTETRLVYLSRLVSKKDCNTILHLSEINNEQTGITGVMIGNDKYFIQVLEGRTDLVHALYEKILQDRRHHDIHCIRVEDNIQYRHYKAPMQWIRPDTKPSRALLSSLFYVFTLLTCSHRVFEKYCPPQIVHANKFLRYKPLSAPAQEVKKILMYVKVNRFNKPINVADARNLVSKYSMIIRKCSAKYAGDIVHFTGNTFGILFDENHVHDAIKASLLVLKTLQQKMPLDTRNKNKGAVVQACIALTYDSLLLGSFGDATQLCYSIIGPALQKIQHVSLYMPTMRRLIAFDKSIRSLLRSKQSAFDGLVQHMGTVEVPLQEVKEVEIYTLNKTSIENPYHIPLTHDIHM